MSILSVRIIGICTLIDRQGGGKRVVLPVDRRAEQRDDGRHIPYVEIDLIDQVAVNGRFVRDKIYTRDLAAYRRFHLFNDRISILNVDTKKASPLNVLSTYEERVPSLSKVAPNGTITPIPGVLSTPPEKSLVAGYFDMTHGDLHTGPPNVHPTVFSTPTKWPTRRLAQWVELQIPIIDKQRPVIQVENFADRFGGTRTIELSEVAARITIGNQLEADIERGAGQAHGPQSEDFRAHFELYYDLFQGVPADASRPERTLSVPNGCVVVGQP
ncbi:MAG TPA: hypothetical protein VKB93_29010 [Thermoanaerobaculia bacterium]|nr:hypothetical protein [Thermoanaerobaculia bacterium]